MKDKDAENLARTTAANTFSYKDDVDTLKTKYDRPRANFILHMKNLAQKRKTEYNFKSIEELCVSIQQIQSGLESCQGLSASPIIASFSTKSYSSYSSSSHHKPSPSTVKSRGHVFQAKERKDVSRALCKGDVHGFGKCPMFKSWNQQKCYNHIRSVNACMNCLHPGHNSRDCQSKYKCRNFCLYHHTLLHREKKTILMKIVHQPLLETTLLIQVQLLLPEFKIPINPLYYQPHLSMSHLKDT